MTVDEKPDVAPAETDTTAADDAEFGAGFAGKEDKPTEKPQAKEKPTPAATPREKVEPKPEYIQITKQDWAEVRAAAAKTASYDQQLSKAFGTIGNLQKLVNGFQAQTPQGRRIEIPKDAFAQMERDFPELAQQTRSALEAALSGVHGTGANDADPAKLEAMMEQFAAQHTSRREIEALEDAYPTWREIVGAVDVTREQPDPNNAFRKWLATKDLAYQTKVNGSESAAVIGRAIRTFQKETAAPVKVNGTPTRDAARADRIRAAVQPRGDAQGAAAGKSDDAMFEEGFNSR